jgi:hypothetical protein
MTTTTAAPAPAAAALAAAPAAPAPAPAQETLFTAAAPAAPAPAPAPGAPAPAPTATDVPAWLPEKYRVLGADGKLDLSASSQKLAEGYSAAQKRIGTGDLPPDDPAKYTFTVPEALKDVKLDESLTNAFRTEAHKAGLTQSQYEFVMGKYFELVPGLLDGAAKVTAEQARSELQQVWKSPAEYEANMSNAQRAIAAAPAELQQAIVERFGTDPVFAQFAALWGKQTREDRPPNGAAAPAAPAAADALMASEAYHNPKHPDHARVSAQVQAHFKRQFGEAAAT